MLSCEKIKNELIECGFTIRNVEYKKTNVINLVKIKLMNVCGNGEDGVILVWTGRGLDNKIYIEAEKKGCFQEEVLKKIDKIIKKAIYETPENQLIFLFKEVFMFSDISKEPLMLKQMDCTTAKLEVSRLLEIACETLNRDEICFYNLVVPNNCISTKIKEYFTASNAIYDIKETNNNSTYFFYRFKESSIEEKDVFDKIKQIMEDNGIPADVSNHYSHSS